MKLFVKKLTLEIVHRNKGILCTKIFDSMTQGTILKNFSEIYV